MLRTRFITAVLIAVVVLALLFTAQPSLFALFSAFVMLAIGGWEAARLSGLQTSAAGWVIGAILLVVGMSLGASFDLITAPAVDLFSPGISVPQLLVVPALVWIALWCWLAIPGFGSSKTALWGALKLGVLSVILLAAWLALSWLHARSPWLVVMLIIIIAAADVGAYFSGRKLGGPKLAPRISPGKTWSGVAGGTATTVIVTSLATFALPVSPFSPLLAGGLALILAWISVGGDLFMSLLKRQQGIKDCSNLLPGHGGILDRLDSLGAALPFFALAVANLGQ